MGTRVTSVAALETLLRTCRTYGGGVAAEKLAAMARLDGARLKRAGEVFALHEALSFLRAYPDDETVHAAAGYMLSRFSGRADLAAHRGALADTGIAGTAIRYPFFDAMARWLARRVPEALTIDWSAFVQHDRLESMLHLLATYSETPGLDEYAFPVREWLARLAGAKTSDAAFVIGRFAALDCDPFVREWLYQELDLQVTIHPGPRTPERSTAEWPAPAIAFQQRPMRRERPDLAREVRRLPLAITPLARRDGARMIDLARTAMVTRSRDLDVFAWGSPDDVRVVAWEDGLSFAMIGAQPARRLMLETVYGFLTLHNGVPIGYALTSELFSSAEIAFNVFDTFRGGEAAWVFVRLLGTMRAVFGVDAYTIYPYQLGDHNDEAQQSGAFWFYQKLGFAPRDPAVLKLMRRELATMKRDPKYRSSPHRIGELGSVNAYWAPGRERKDVIGEVDLAAMGLGITRALAARGGADREAAVRAFAREAAHKLGNGPRAGWSAGERLAWNRWAPLVAALPDVERWTAAERRALAAVMRAKGGPRESDYSLLFDQHRPLRRALLRLARKNAE